MENENDEITFGEKIDLFKQLKELHTKVQTVREQLVNPSSIIEPSLINHITNLATNAITRITGT
jgi:hypothetical protein